MNINFFFPEKKITLSNRADLKKFIIKLFGREGFRVDSISYVFCSDKTLLQMNKDYLGHNYYTDIITFDLSSDPAIISGEIYISYDRVRENAENFDVSFKNEIHRVIFHGALHLCGYRDKKQKEITLMRMKEEEYLKSYFGVPRGT